MKKSLLLLLCLLSFPAMFAAESIPYDCVTMNNSEWKGYADSTPAWTNLSNTSNKPSDCASTGFVRLWRYSAVDNIDAWISSPELALEAGKIYSISFYYVTFGDAATHADLLEGRLTPTQVTSADQSAQYASITPFCAIEDINGTSSYVWHKAEYTATAATGDKHVAFRFSGKYCKCIGLTDFHISEAADPSAPQAPEGATAVAAVADADGAISATVSWTLPTLDVKGNPLSTIESVEVLRDDAVAATLAGTATTWTDTEATGLTAGTHTYAIRIKANGLESELSEAVTVKVGPWDYAPADFSGWTSFTTSGNNWVTNSNKPSGSLQSGSMRIWAASQINNIDSWLTSPRLGMVAGKTYKLKFKYLVWYDDAAVIEHFRGHLATEIPNADNSATIAASPAFLELDNLVKGSNSSDWKEVSLTITPAEGQQYVTFHVFGNYCKCILISDFSIETYAEKPFVPAAPTDLKATAGANHALTVALEWTNPTRDTEGELFGADKTIDNILVYRDGTLAATLEGTATSWTDSEADGLTAGDHTYAVSAVVAGVESALSEEAAVTNVGPLQPLDPALWESNFATDGNEFATLWCTYAGTGNMGGSWIYNSSNKRIQLMNAYGYNEDAWLMTPPFIFKPRQYYTLTIEGYCTSDEHPLTLALVEDAANPSVSQYIINQTKPDADHTMTLDTEAGTKTFEFYFYPLKPTAAKMQHAPYNPDVPRYIAIHANNSGIGANTFIHSIKIEEVAGKLTGIEEVATDDAPVAIEVYDITGRKLGNASSTQLEEYAAGAYIIRAISADGSSATKKIIR